MECAHRRQHGASIVEAVIALPILLVIILGSIQFALVYEAKATLNHASLQAARLGAVRHAEPAAMRRGLARGLVPLYSPDSSLTGIVRSIGRIDASLATDARIRILNPTREAFDDFGVDANGEREIPNDRLHTRATSAGAQSGINIQDANLLKVQVTYGYELQVPLVNWFIARVLLGVRRGADPFEQQLLRRLRIPIIATATVRMQSPARLNDAVMSINDFPTLNRIPVDTTPPSTTQEPQQEEEPDEPGGGQPEQEPDTGSGLDEGFFGFGSGSTGGGNGSGDGDSGGGVNGGNPLSCGTEDGNQTIAALAVGNPIHVVTGNKYQLETDLAALPGTLGLAVLRHYNSVAGGWRWNYDVRLHSRKGGGLDIVQSDGRLIRFDRSAEPATYLAQRASDGSVVASGEGHEWRGASGRLSIFDRDGRLSGVREADAELVLTHGARGELVSVRDSQERTLRIEYHANGRIATIRGPAGFGMRYLYDDRGNLSQSVATDGTSRRYLYEDIRHPRHLTGIEVGSVRPLAYGPRSIFERLATWSYDEAGRAVSSSHPQDADKVTLAYGNGYTDVTDAFNRTTRYVTELRGGVALVREVRGPGCGTCGQGDAQYAYDDRFRVVSIATKQGGIVDYQYDDQGRVATLSRVVAGKAETLARYSYDGSSPRPSRVERPSVNPDARVALTFEYTAVGLLASMGEAGFAPEGDGFREIRRETRLHYDSGSRLVRIDGPREGVDDVTDIEYDEHGRVERIKSAAGEKRVMRYDAAGRPTRIAQTGQPDLALDYDVHGRITAVTQLRSRGSRTLRYRYDVAGRLAETIDPDGRSRRYRFDAAGRPTLLESSDSQIAVGVRYAPDDQIERAGAVGANGRLLQTLYYAYDAERRLTEVRDGDGQPLQRFSYLRDVALPDRAVDPLGHATLFAYDALGRVASVLAPDGGLTRFDRDEQGRLTRLQAPNDASTTFLYDDFGRRVEERSADRGVTQYRYDAAGNLIEKVDARGMKTRLAYDAANKLVRVERAEGVATLSYANGRLMVVDEAQTGERFQYDVDGQVVVHTRHVGARELRTRFSYDAAGRIQTRVLPSGVRLRYRYNDRGSLQSITQERWLRDRMVVSASSEAVRLDALGHFVSGNGVDTRTSFDAKSGNIARRVVDGVAAFAFDYDEAERVNLQRRNRGEHRFGYDAVGRLASMSSPLRNIVFDYDRNGNRVSSSASLRALAVSVTERYGYEPRSNRLSRITGATTTHYRYDAAGNPLEVGSRRYEYDTSGRPTALFEHDRLSAEYRYNFWGERVMKTVHAEAASTRFIYEQQKLIAEANANGVVTREYIYVGQHPVALIERGELFWIHTDHRGAPVAVTNEVRTVIWRADYEPFGAAVVSADPDGDGRRFELNLRSPGQYADAESGTSYNYFRDYDPKTGRYLSPDPLGTFDGTNTFAYAHNDPLRRADSLGLYDEMIHYYMTYFLGLVAGLPQDVARTMAIASQFIDENYQTQPIRSGLVPNWDSLPLYHFVLDYDRNNYGDFGSDPMTRFYSPGSDQLNRLSSAADADRLRDLWTRANPTMCPAPWTIDSARYQLYGEFLHSFADTFAHRDVNNVPYADVNAPWRNTPWSLLGHGTGAALLSDLGRAPDHTYNQEYEIFPATCAIPGSMDPHSNLSQAECIARGGVYSASTNYEWRTNELRTLRMQYEMFNRIRTDFRDVIGPEKARWSDIAGLGSWQYGSHEANARIGIGQSFEAWAADQGVSRSGMSTLYNPNLVLQQFNSTKDPDQARDLLNAWLAQNDFGVTIESWSLVQARSAEDRERNIGWIPNLSIPGVLLPAEHCAQGESFPLHPECRPDEPTD